MGIFSTEHVLWTSTYRCCYATGQRETEDEHSGLVVGAVQALVAPNGKGCHVPASREGRGGRGRGGTLEVEKEKGKAEGGRKEERRTLPGTKPGAGAGPRGRPWQCYWGRAKRRNERKGARTGVGRRAGGGGGGYTTRNMSTYAHHYWSLKGHKFPFMTFLWPKT